MPESKIRIAVLGSSGSIGLQTLDVVSQHTDKLEIVALALHAKIDVLEQQARKFEVGYLAVGDESLAYERRSDTLKNYIEHYSEAHTSTTAQRSADNPAFLGFGAEAVLELIKLPEVDVVVNALVGAAGLRASYETLKQGKRLALANKESLVVGGDLIMPLATHDTLLPIDSEHGALYQCLLGEQSNEVSCLWITASGGPFRGKTLAELQDISPEEALAHPTWNMGAKISIDSSTLMNKGLEVIEAHHLFAMPYDKIRVVVQPQSAIHSMVEFIDGSVKAHLGTTDMRIPIQYALSYPERWDAPVKPLDFRMLGSLEFEAPDTKTFRALLLAELAGRTGGTMPCVMNAANEVAVASFLAGECRYLSITECVEAVMDAHTAECAESLDQLEETDSWARLEAKRFLRGSV